MQKLIRKGFLLFIMTAMVGLTVFGCGNATNTTDKISPIIDQDGADPFVTVYEDKYLYTKTTGSNISIAIADSIQTLGAAELKIVYDPQTELSDLWAPEIWFLDDTWYIYFAATIPGESIHRMFVLSNHNANPMEGEWTCREVDGMDDTFAIDGTIMELNGKRYFLWSGWEGYENVRQDIYLAEMTSPTAVLSEKILLTKPELDWETIGNPLVNEGPEILIKENTVNLVYSASGSWTDDYCLGVLTMNLNDDPKNPQNWTKHEKPILSKTDTVYGPGHNSFVSTLDGKEELIIYHAARWEGAGWTRGVRYGYVNFESDGKIAALEPISGQDFLKIPSGENKVTVYDYSTFQLHGELETNTTENYVSGFEYFDDYISLNIQSTENTDAYLVVFAKVDDLLNGAVTSIALKLDGESIVRDLCSGEDYQPLFFPVSLKSGNNEVSISSDMGGTKIYISRLELRN